MGKIEDFLKKYRRRKTERKFVYFSQKYKWILPQEKVALDGVW